MHPNAKLIMCPKCLRREQQLYDGMCKYCMRQEEDLQRSKYWQEYYKDYDEEKQY